MFKNTAYIFLFILGFCSMNLTAVEASQTSLQTQSSAEGLKKLLKQMQTLEGSFEQSVFTEDQQLLERQQGQFFLKKTGKLYWEIKKPKPRLIISSGKKIWDFDPILEQVIIQTIRPEMTLTPAIFLSHDLSTFAKEFFITEKLEDPRKTSGSQPILRKFIVKPKRMDSPFERIELAFRGRLLQELGLWDALGRQTQIVFKQVQLNQPISDAQFRFKIPAHVDVLE